MTSNTNVDKIRQDIKNANLPEAVLHTTLRKLGQLPLNEWVTNREFEYNDEEDGPCLRGLWLERGKLTSKKHRQIWHRFAAELVLTGQGVIATDLGTLSAWVVNADPVLLDWAEDNIGHLFVDHFFSSDMDACPLSPERLYAVKTFLYGWMDRGRAVHPYCNPEASQWLAQWWGDEFSDFLEQHVSRFVLSN